MEKKKINNKTSFNIYLKIMRLSNLHMPNSQINYLLNKESAHLKIPSPIHVADHKSRVRTPLSSVLEP